MPAMTACSTELSHFRVRSRRQNQIGDVSRQRAVFLGLGACCQPVGMSRERVPFLFALRKILPFEDVGKPLNMLQNIKDFSLTI